MYSPNAKTLLSSSEEDYPTYSTEGIFDTYSQIAKKNYACIYKRILVNIIQYFNTYILTLEYLKNNTANNDVACKELLHTPAIKRNNGWSPLSPSKKLKGLLRFNYFTIKSLCSSIIILPILFYYFYFQ